MKNLLITIFVLFSNISIFAQNKVEITGQVKDLQNKTALEFCTISVLNSKDSLITGGITNNKGFFIIPVDRGTYKIITSFIGFKSDTIKSVDIYENKFLAVIRLKSDVNSLSEVTVKANSSQNLLDRDVQIVTDKMKVGASNTKEVLEKVNGVTYDRYSNSIKVDNDEKVIILVDGMQKDQEYIKNLPPDRLKKIEVIRDPGGRYALEGYSAVINVILKKDYQGTDIYVSNHSMLDVDASKTTYIPVQNISSASINYVYNKLNVYTNLNNSINHFNLPSTSIKEYTDGVKIEKLPINDEMNTNVHEMYNNATFGADYYLNPKHTISFESNLGNQPFANNRTQEIYNTIYSKDGNIWSEEKIETVKKTKSLNSSNSIFYIGKFDENNELNVDFTYSYYDNKNTNIYSDNLISNLIEKGNDKKNQTNFSIDFNHSFKNKTSINLGCGNTWEKVENDFTTSSSTSKSSYYDLINRLYAYYAWQKSKKISFDFGTAVETSSYVFSDTISIKRNYLIFRPYLDLKYTQSKHYGIKLKYRVENNYPYISQTNPFTVFVDKESVKVGNPKLRPDLTHKFSLQNDILGGFITIEPYFNFSNNLISESGKLRADSIFEYSYGNAGNYKNYGIEGRMNIPLGKKFIFQPNFEFYNSSIEFEGKTNEFFDWKMSSQLIYQNEKTSTVAGFNFQKNMAKHITAQGYNKWDNDFWITFVQQPFFKQKLNVMLLYFLPINLGCDFGQGSYIETEQFSESKIGDISFLKNMIMIQLSYRFNKGKTVNKTEKNSNQINENNKKGMF